mgnify:FL=1
MIEDNVVVLVTLALRLCVAGITAYGALALALEGKEGWGWMIFATIVLGGVSVSSREE